MSLPTAPTIEQTTGREAIKRDFYDLDSLITELNTPKEEINNGRPAGMQNFAADPLATEQEPVEQISPEVAALSGKMIAGTIDTGLSTVFSIYAKASSPEKYEATDKQIAKLESAWQAVAQKYNYQVSDSPWFNVILLTVAVYFPLYKEAQKDHRFAEMDEKLADMQRQIRENETRLNLMAQQKPAA